MFAALYAEQPVLLALGLFAACVAVTALSLPGAAIMTLAAGASFGLVMGTVLVSFASTLGATLAMLAARYLLRDSIQARFGRRLDEVNQGIKKEGALYLFTLRLIPLVPFFVLNLLMGLTRIRTWTYFCVSQLGMLAGTVVYGIAGTQIAKIDSLQSIASPALIGSFVLLGLLPLLVNKVLQF
ncbi:MAG: VTT domain-containing protein [Polaromonas sp.]|uniref:TVP38/TMEM64 family protein n=1 Tax=Polaromonas sp. TaxID=1869339 RepID=UPI002732FAA6|nr:VTT domain-containing protein [Polaromonas sp.]MDP2817520.1 VTT domain-containing protein [Polaromonas sp.]